MMKKTYCIRISLNLGVALCNGILLFVEDQDVKNMV